jgi:O-antigen/teichoic acid export membrane protein
MTAGTMVRFLGLDYAASLASTMTATLLPIVVVSSSGSANGAFFYIPWVMVTTLSLVPLYLSASLTVQASAKRDQLELFVRHTLAQMARMLLPIVVLIFIGAELLLSVFGATYAREGSGLLRVASLGVLPFGLNVLFLAVARVQGRGRAILSVQVFLTVVTLGLSIVLLPQLGIVGVGVAWLAANGAVAVVVGWLELRPLLLPTSAVA